MRGGSSREVVRHVRTLFQFGVTGSFGDEQLLGRFLASRDEAAEEAFAELVRRHGPMVLGVCRRILGDAHDAEDAFQATFLVLARRAATVARREKVASWLYGVAVRTAREARVRSSRRRAREERVKTTIHVDPPDDGSELREILDEELARLPARQRGPVVLCELEGLSRPEAARRLGIPEGTLSSRLARAKARLRDRLASRGVALPVAAVSALLVREARAAAVPLSLFESTVQAATLVAAGPGSAAALVLSVPVASLSEGVIHTMFVAKLKGIVLAAGTMAAVVSGAVVLAQPGGRGGAPPSANRYWQEETKGELPPTERQRVAALEQKLDRVLEALDRLSKPNAPALMGTLPPSPRGTPEEPMPPAPPAQPTAVPAPVQRPPAGGMGPLPNTSAGSNRPAALLSPAVNQSVASTKPPAAPMSPASPSGAVELGQFEMFVTSPRTMAQRLEAVEAQYQQMQQRLERLEKRLGALDARVGGGEARTRPASLPFNFEVGGLY